MRLGKPTDELMSRTVYRMVGKRRSNVLQGPGRGLDTSIVRLSPGKVMAATSDPISYLPKLGPKASAWLSIHLLASDLTTTGFAPQFGLFDFNLPPTMEESRFAAFWKRFQMECKELGVSIVGGHTGKYPGIDYTIIGGGVLIATGSEDAYLTSSMAQPGDEIILTKGAAIETTCVLARTFPRKVRKALGPRLFENAWSYLKKTSTVKDALAASSIGVRREGVTAMHDATEGGVIAGLIELTTASRLGAIVNLDEIRVSEETRELCKLFRMDPYISLSEGSLIVASRPSKTSRLLTALASKGIQARVVGGLTSKFQGCKGSTAKRTTWLRYPKTDPYWRAYANGISKNWS